MLEVGWKVHNDLKIVNASSVAFPGGSNVPWSDWRTFVKESLFSGLH